MQRQSASDAPGIATAPRSVVQVPMTDGEPTGFGEVSVSELITLKCLKKRRRRMRT